MQQKNESLKNTEGIVITDEYIADKAKEYKQNPHIHENVTFDTHLYVSWLRDSGRLN